MPKIYEGYRFTLDDGTKKGIGVDEEGNLYWDRKRIVTQGHVRLSWPVNAAAIVAALATAVQAAVAVLEYLRA